MYLATAGLASINYVQDRYIFYYDMIEDIAVGKTFMITGGMQQKKTTLPARMLVHNLP